MNINLDLILSQLDDGDEIAKLFDLTQSAEARWQALQDLIQSSRTWKHRVNDMLALKAEGKSDSYILDFLVNDLDLHFGSFTINARFARGMLPPEKIAAYEEGFSFLLNLQEQHEAQKELDKKLKKKPQRAQSRKRKEKK